MIKRLLATAAIAAAMLVPAAPSHATTCVAADPTVDAVVCGTVYPVVAQLACKVKLLCY